jgi:enterochelin esterase-like enzyme
MHYCKGKRKFIFIVAAVILSVAATLTVQPGLKTFAASNLGTAKLAARNSWKSNKGKYQQFNCNIFNTGSPFVSNWMDGIPVNGSSKVSQAWNAPYSFSNYASTMPTMPTTDTEDPITMDISDHSLPNDYNTYIQGNTYGTLQSFTYYSKITKTMRPANIILPYNYSKDKKYPVLYMLHGIGGDQNSWCWGNSCSLLTMAGNLVSAGKAEDMIIVMPYIRVSATPETNIFAADNFKYYDLFKDELINNLMPYMEKHYSIKTGRENTAVAGFSMGGRESLNIGISRPDLFGYTGAFCPAPGIFEETDMGVHDKGLFPSQKAFTIPDEYKNNTVIMIVKGTTDMVVNEFPQTYHTALVNNKVPHYFYETEGGHEERVWGHGYYNFLQRIFGKTVE